MHVRKHNLTPSMESKAAGEQIFDSTSKQEARVRWGAFKKKYQHYEDHYSKNALTTLTAGEGEQQFISGEEWGDQWAWAFLPSPYSLDAARKETQTRGRE